MARFTKPNGYWVYMNYLMLVEHYTGAFKQFAEANDWRWQLKSDHEKTTWKEKAIQMKNLHLYKNVYRHVETALKKHKNSEEEANWLKMIRQCIICFMLFEVFDIQ